MKSRSPTGQVVGRDVRRPWTAEVARLEVGHRERRRDDRNNGGSQGCIPSDAGRVRTDRRPAESQRKRDGMPLNPEDSIPQPKGAGRRALYCRSTMKLQRAWLSRSNFSWSFARVLKGQERGANAFVGML